MSCICQFYTPSQDIPRNLETVPMPTINDFSVRESPKDNASKESLETNAPDNALSTSDLADCRSQNWLLKKKLLECEITIQNLEQLVTTVVEKQHQILSEMFHLRKENRELQSECHLQREYHSMERNALMRELHVAQTLGRSRNFLLGCRSNESKRISSFNTGEPPLNSGATNGDSEEAYTSESYDEDHVTGCNGESGSDTEEYSDVLLPSSAENSGSASLSLSGSAVLGDTDSEDNRSLDCTSNEDSNSDSSLLYN
ncbi:uncharacterized protein LOC128256976 isoform X1 [Drosophila gunungcola]|uniref:uncharacterized protein LOC128256976 isoform X1 n=1 Tax=Drosophila gunungcola TaxID=103775 RepID=UPI0022E96FF9|nr:uncharacterized protein LOC128256976 isoform X1 [Drosophila gunungcola]